MLRNRFIAISFSTFVVFAAVSFSASGHGLSGAVSKVNKATATHRVKPTATPSQTPQALIKSSPSATHPATPTPIDTPVEIATGDTTEAFSPTPTYTDTPTSTATPTSTPTVSTLERKGVARYQNHKSDAGILISVVDASNKVLSSTATDTKGR